MTHTKNLKKTMRFFCQLSFVFSMFFLTGFSQAIFAEGVFEKKQKARHSLFGAELKKIKAEHRSKFANSKGRVTNKSDNPWEKKRQKNQRNISKVKWGECRDYALKKRNRCYREGRNAYRCEQRYDARTRLCNNDS